MRLPVFDFRARILCAVLIPVLWGGLFFIALRKDWFAEPIVVRVVDASGGPVSGIALQRLSFLDRLFEMPLDAARSEFRESTYARELILEVKDPAARPVRAEVSIGPSRYGIEIKDLGAAPIRLAAGRIPQRTIVPGISVMNRVEDGVFFIRLLMIGLAGIAGAPLALLGLWLGSRGLAALHGLLARMPARIEAPGVARVVPALLFALAVLIGFAFFESPGMHDVGTWLEKWWMPNFEKYGFFKGYAMTGDNYPPLSFVMIGLVKMLAEALNASKLIVYKSLLMTFLLASTALFYFRTRSFFYAALFHLGLILGSVALGYFDIFFVPFLFLALFNFEKGRYIPGVLAFCLAALMKYQPLIIAPAILLFLVHNSMRDGKLDGGKLGRIVLPALGVIGVAALVWGPFFFFSLVAAAGHPSLSIGAYNFGWLLTWLLQGLFPVSFGSLGPGGIVSGINPANPLVPYLTALPRLLFALSFLFVLYAYWKKRNKSFIDLLLACALGYLCYFMLNPGVHQNHLFILCAIFPVIAFLRPAFSVDAVFWVLYSNINNLLQYGLNGSGFGSFSFFGLDASVPMSACGVVLFAVFYFRVVRTWNSKDPASAA